MSSPDFSFPRVGRRGVLAGGVAMLMAGVLPGRSSRSRTSSPVPDSCRGTSMFVRRGTTASIRSSSRRL